MGQLALEGIVQRFGPEVALDGITFTVDTGEFFVLLGPSAAGKTTTLRTICGLERPDAGHIVFEGADITAAPVQRRPMAMIFQTFALYPHLTVRGNLAFGLDISGIDRKARNRRIEDVSEMLRISHTLDRLPATLSGGEQQRVAIGRALTRQPRLLLLDEPLTNLDAKLRHDMRAEFKRLHRELGMTMIYATPDQLEALTMGERIAVIRNGRVVQTGSPDRLYDRPDNDFVAGLVGAPAINLVPASCRSDTIALPFADIREGPWQTALRAFGDTESLLFGIRPHDLAPAGDPPCGPIFEAIVHLVEPLGDVTILDLMTPSGHTLKMVLSEDRAVSYPPGQTLRVEIALEQTHIFARDTGTAIR